MQIRANDSVGQRWSAFVNVTWNEWPTSDPIIGDPAGSSPGDRLVTGDWEVTAWRTQWIRDELRTSWVADEFELEGTYKASVIVELVHEVEESDGAWKTMCRRSDDATVRVHWSE